ISNQLLTLVIANSLSANEKRIEARTIEQKYNNFFNNSLEAIFTADKNYRINYTNQTFKDLIKFDDESEFDFRTLFVDDNYSDFLTSITPKSESTTRRAQLKNCKGEILEVYISITRIYSDSEDTYFQGVVHDVTELK